MRSFELTTSVWVPAPIERVFEFFSQAGNLERLTPAFLHFRTLTDGPIAMRAGTIIEYRITLRGLPLTWRSEITEWDPPHRFVDEQRRGPYRRWRHVHGFEARDGGTRVSDRVEYATWGGRLVNRLFVAPDLRRIFTYRQSALAGYFGGSAPPAAVRITSAAGGRQSAVVGSRR